MQIRSFLTVAALAAGLLGAAAATPADAAITGVRVQAPAARTEATPVYWVWRHHHRFWVPDHRRYRR